ncbi:YggS family pyridoxal phosphate-dependent enzyme [Candidatus Woesearchaeota archaeon]|nr:YggS family pyridoxal phosphate-dependent enzyme [Candidatus Woesearchaeota archaeon]
MTIKENLDKVYDKIRAAAERSGRKAEDIMLVVVTKSATAEQVDEAIGCGAAVIAENRIQAAEDKFRSLDSLTKKGKAPAPEKHMIGHLQTNKVKAAVRLFDLIQSVDSIRLAEEIDRRASDIGREMPVFIEINLSGEEQRYGIRPEDLDAFYKSLSRLKNLKVTGLMGIAPHILPEKTRPYFRRIKKLFDRLGLRWLSIGMSNDYEIAIEEGSNMVRIGTAIFAEQERQAM